MMGDDLLRGEKVRLTPLYSGDLDLLTAWFSSDMGMLRRLGQHPVYPMTRTDEERWLQSTREERDVFHFAIRTLADNALIGTTSIFQVNWRSRHAELGITLGSQRGQGYGRDAVRVLLRYGFMELNLNRVYLRVHGDNVRAIKSYEGAGFVQEGAVREALLREGHYTDMRWMSVLRREWEVSMMVTSR